MNINQIYQYLLNRNHNHIEINNLRYRNQKEINKHILNSQEYQDFTNKNYFQIQLTIKRFFAYLVIIIYHRRNRMIFIIF